MFMFLAIVNVAISNARRGTAEAMVGAMTGIKPL